MTTANSRKNAPTTRGRPFPAGNPGRPKGARHRITMLAEKLMEDDAAEVVKSVIGAAKAGDMVAARLILERISPPRKGSPVTFDLPPVATAADVLTALGAVVQAVGEGELTPDEGVTVASLLESKRKALETVDLEARIAALEKKA